MKAKRRPPCQTAFGRAKKRYRHKPIVQAEAMGDGVRPYRCPDCGWWHIGHPVKT